VSWLVDAIPALRVTSRRLASVVSSLQPHILRWSLEQADRCAAHLLCELQFASWDEPAGVERFPVYLSQEANARRLCTQCKVLRVWASAIGRSDRLEHCEAVLAEAIEWAASYPNSPDRFHPDVLAVRAEVARLCAAKGHLESAARLGKEALEDAAYVAEDVASPYQHWSEHQRSQQLVELKLLRDFLAAPLHSYVVAGEGIKSPIDATALEAVVAHDADNMGDSCDDCKLATDDLKCSKFAAEITTQEIAGRLWISCVERLLREPVGQASSNLTLITFSCCTSLLRDSILALPLVSDYTAQGVDIQPGWANGAFIFAPIQPKYFDFALQPRHVVVLGEYQLLSLLSALDHLPYEHRKLKPQGMVAFDGAASNSQEEIQHLLGLPSGAAHFDIAEEPKHLYTEAWPLQSLSIDP